MKKKGSNKIVITDSFQAWAHKWGRIGTLIALLYMIAIPFVVLTFYDSLPSIGEVINLSTISILMVYIPVGFSEAISYTPILGASSYLTFITGNIMNLKLPCAVNAMKLTKKEPNTPEGEAISSVAVAVCSIMTIIILALAALLSAWISPVFELPAVKTASNYLIPALFGSLTLGCKKRCYGRCSCYCHYYGACPRCTYHNRFFPVWHGRLPDFIHAPGCHYFFTDYVEKEYY